MSQSIFTRAKSALDRASAICSALTGLSPAPLSWPFSLSRTQWPNVCTGTARILAVKALIAPGNNADW